MQNELAHDPSRAVNSVVASFPSNLASSTGFESQRDWECRSVKWSSAEPFDIEELDFFTHTSQVVCKTL